MTEFLYEKDLRGMQYHILISTRHDRVIDDLAQHFGLDKQRLRRLLIERLDMILLENLPARYEAWQQYGDAEDDVARALGQELLTRYIPLLEDTSLQAIVEETRARIHDQVPFKQAVEKGQERIREVLFL
jgi:hypothetical protein